MATIGILHERFIRQREEVSEQLQVAFTTRIILEQAKGVVAQATTADMDEAFATLRRFARHHNLLLSEVARRVVSRELAVDALALPVRTPTSNPDEGPEGVPTRLPVLGHFVFESCSA